MMRGETLALDDISLRIGAGEHVAIIGPNGCGKSTFIKAITRECYPLAREESSLKILGSKHGIFSSCGRCWASCPAT